MAREHRRGRRGDAPRDKRGARAAGAREGRREKKSKAGWLVPLLILLALIVAAAIILPMVLGDDDDSADQAATGTSETTTPTDDSQTTADEQAAAGGGPAGGGQLLAGEQPILPLPPGGDLTQYQGQAVTGESVPVESVVSDEGFWVGTSEQDRVFLLLARDAESPFKVRAGESVTVADGSLRPVTGTVPGLTASEGDAQLRSQGAYVEVSQLERG